MNGEGENAIRCPLCGNIFQNDLSKCPKGCLWGKTCKLICCPRCHYQFVEESKTVNLLKRIFKGKRRSADEQG